MTEEGDDAVSTIVYRLTKTARFIPTMQPASGADTARVIVREAVRLHVVPTGVEGDTRFTGEL